MKRTIFIVTLLVVLCPSIGFCQEAEEAEEQLIAVERRMELRNLQLEAEEIEFNAHFRRQMQEFELEERQIELEHLRKELDYPAGGKRHHKKCAGPFVLICLIVHILVAVWVYTDIRKRKAGSGIWIVISLLAGLFGALVYAIVRLGDSRETQAPDLK